MCKYPLTAALGLQAAPIVDCLISSVKFEFCDRRSMANSMVYLCLQICLQVCILYNHSFFLHSFINSFSVSVAHTIRLFVLSFIHNHSLHSMSWVNLTWWIFTLFIRFSCMCSQVSFCHIRGCPLLSSWISCNLGMVLILYKSCWISAVKCM